MVGDGGWSNITNREKGFSKLYFSRIPTLPFKLPAVSFSKGILDTV